MQIDKRSIAEIAEAVATSVVEALKREGIVGNGGSGKPRTAINEKSAYAKTEALLYNYKKFQKLVDERRKEIADLRKYGVPQSCGGGERVQNGNIPHGIVLPEESVESAVCKIECAIEHTVQAIAMIDRCMAALKNDPYYRVLELRYFEGRTQEDIALEYGVSQVTISNNKGRLVRELAMRIFPNQVIDEMLS